MNNNLQFKMIEWLHNENARVFNFADAISILTQAKGSSVSAPVVRSILDSVEMAGLIEKARKGLWLNKVVTPAPFLADIASIIRSDAIISLQSIFNIDEKNVFAVIPAGSGFRGDSGEIRTDIGVLNVHALPPKFFIGSLLDSNLPYKGFKKEKALIDWIWLGLSSRSKVLPPDVNYINFVNESVCKEIADKLKISDLFTNWKNQSVAINYKAKNKI